MLKHLSITNFALIKTLSVDFHSGLSVITGETGAGKSIILDALQLLLGQRADMSVLKNPEKKCVIEGEFDISSLHLQTTFEQLDIDFDTQTFIRREILPSGKSRAFVNDTPVSLQKLKTLTAQLVDIHSQHQTYELFDRRKQLELLDDFAQNHPLLSEYQQHYTQYTGLKQTLARFREQMATAVADKDYLEFQLNELTELHLSESLSPEEYEEKINTLSNIETIKSTLHHVSGLLTENELSVEQLLYEIRTQLRSIENFGSSYARLLQRIETVLIDIQDIASEAAQMAEEAEYNPEELARLQEQYNRLVAVMQKHRCQTVNELQQVEEELAEKLLSINTSDSKIAEIENQINTQEEILRQLAEQLTWKRKEAARKLSNNIAAVLKQIGMPQARVEIAMEHTPDFTATGNDEIEFLFSANKGVEVQAVKKIASGGELSRFMLALKQITAQNKQLPTLIFDEIDTGVSGEVSHKMGEILQQLAQKAQVISITHAPQIAAKADYHYYVYKQTRNNETLSHIKLLDREQRITELAKILSGNKITDTAIEHAKSLLVH